MKNTKTKLISSVALLLICFAMLIGSTFAWFTDSASTGANRIQAGTLKVGFKKFNGTSWVDAEGNKLEWVIPDNRTQEQILWEPGVTYKLNPLKVTNNGNLTLKYKALINSVDGNTDLLDALEFGVVYGIYDEESEDIVYIAADGTGATPFDNKFDSTAKFTLDSSTNLPAEMPLVDYGYQTEVNGNLLKPDKSLYMQILVHMKESANNDYQNKSIDSLGITIVATQASDEQDSYDNTYDQNAEYPVIVSSQDAFSETVAASNNSNIVLSAGTYTLPAATNKTIAISGTKDTVIDLTSPTGQSLSGTDLTFENVTVKGINQDYVGIQHSGDIVYNNVTFNDSTTLYGESVTFNDCTFNLSARYIWTYGAKEVTFNNCTFNTDGKAILIYAEGGVDSQTVNVNGCTFNATVAGYTSSGDQCAAVEIDASLISGTYTVNFTGTNRVDTKFNGTYRIKNNSGSKVTINGIN